MKIFDPDSEMNLSPCRRNVFAIFAILIIVLSVYSNTFDASWHFDDEPNILKNNPLHLTELNLKNIKNTFFASWDGSGKLYRPVACLSFALNYYFGGTEVFGYHLINLTFHCLSAVFLFLFIYHTLNLPILKERYGGNGYYIALLSTVLWAINPVQTQAVTYIVQRMASMAGMFYIASMYFFLKGRTSELKAPRVAHYILCLVCAILSLGSKENAVMLPMTLLFFDLFLIRGITKKSLKKYAFLFLIAALSCAIVAVLLKGPLILDPENIVSGYRDRVFTLFERLWTEPRIVLFYITLLLYPMPDRLCISHDISLSKGLLDPPMAIIAGLTILALIGLAVMKSKRWPLVSFCILFFFMNHAIESTIIALDLTFEHRNYIPSMLFFVPVGILVVKGTKFFSHRKAMQVIIVGFVILVLISFGHSTFMRNFAWKTNETLWLDAVEKSPNLARTHHNLGRCYADIGFKQMALDQYLEALSLPDGPNRRAHHLTHYNIGLIYRSFHDHDRARRHFLKAVEIEPRLSPAYTCLGILDLEKGKNDKALGYFIKALSHDMDSRQARNYAGFALLREKQIESAVNQFHKVLKANPNDLYALTHLGVAYKCKGELDKALKCFKRALGIDQRYVTAALHLIEVHALKGEGEQAERTAQELIDLFPNDKLTLLINKRIIQTDPLLVPPNLKLISPVLEKTLIKKGYQDHTEAIKLRNYRKQKHGHQKNQARSL